MPSSKLITFFMVSLILISTISHATSRPEPASREGESRHKVVEDAKTMDIDEPCDGIGEDECLMRRTLAAHTDYLYTQKQNKH